MKQDMKLTVGFLSQYSFAGPKPFPWICVTAVPCLAMNVQAKGRSYPLASLVTQPCQPGCILLLTLKSQTTEP